MKVLGICCACQTAQAVFSAPDMDHSNEGEVYDERLYVMANHQVEHAGPGTGPWCDGHGTVPQALVNVKE